MEIHAQPEKKEAPPNPHLHHEDPLDDHLGLPLGDRLKPIEKIIHKSVAIKDSLC
jgi:hypothetical protein